MKEGAWSTIVSKMRARWCRALQLVLRPCSHPGTATSKSGAGPALAENGHLGPTSLLSASASSRGA